MLSDLISGHELSILIQRDECNLILNQFSNNNLDRYLIEKNTTIFKKLRSKLMPENHLSHYAENYYNAYQGHGKPMTFVVILASDTALKETPKFINFIQDFNFLKVKPQINFILLNWLNLNDIVELSKDQRSQKFTSLMEKLHKYLKDYLTDYKLHPIDLEFNHDSIVSPEIFALEFKNVIEQPQGKIQQDVAWIQNFYQRENSYKSLNNHQPLVDLAIRRGTAQWAQKNIFDTHQDSSMNFLITSELNKRFLKCYRADCAIFNVALDAPHD
ncbi:MAG: hypothetical protein ACRYGR_04965 [Janthinobacterium lividum]